MEALNIIADIQVLYTTCLTTYIDLGRSTKCFVTRTFLCLLDSSKVLKQNLFLIQCHSCEIEKIKREAWLPHKYKQ